MQQLVDLVALLLVQRRILHIIARHGIRSPELKIGTLSPYAPEDRDIDASCCNNATGLSVFRVDEVDFTSDNNAKGLHVLRAEKLDITGDNNATGLSVLGVDELDLHNCATDRTDGNATLAAKNSVPA